LDAEPEDIGRTIQASPGLMVHVLRLVNSSAYGLSSPISDMSHAVCILGRAKLESLVLGIAVKAALPKPALVTFDPTRFWRGSFRRAALAKTLSDELHPADSADAFTIGMLQDMAVPVLATARAEDYAPVMREWMSDSEEITDLKALEHETIGTDHPTIGTLLGEHWGMPATLVQGIAAHHHADDPHTLPAVHLVSLLREGEGAPELERLVAEASDRYGLGADRVVEAVRSAFKDADELARNLE
jgi:HD-like signal output (HDOD) protein